jgi:hypothetical protein
MSIIKTVVFPDKSAETSDVSPTRLWAVTSPPMELEDIDEIDADRTLSIISEIHELREAVSNPTVETGPSEGTSNPVLREAWLANTTPRLIVDEDDDVVDLDGHLNSDGPLFPKTGEPLEAALIARANERIEELRSTEEATIVGFGSKQIDDRLNWRVSFWMPTEESAIKRAAEMNESAKRRARGKAIVLLATTTE